jgi:hypothetical protein
VSAPTFAVSWFWDWVPPAGRTAEQQATWIANVAGLFEEWAGAKVAEPGVMGPAMARDLLERADSLPGDCRLVWGAGFVDEEARWLPLTVVAEFREPRSADTAYLMTAVGAEGFPDDIRDPKIEYVSTGHGDGVRVLALARAEGDGLHGRVNAALRLEAPAPGLDVLLSTRVRELGAAGAIGFGVEALMNLIAAGGGDL